MKIKDLRVDGFGVWKGLSVEEVSPEITVFYGRNEAGKTTLMQFVRSMFFGFSPERRDRYVPPVYGGLAGGVMIAETDYGQLNFHRQLEASRIHSIDGELNITSPDGGTVSNTQLAQLLSAVDEPTFSNVFALGLREIQELGALNNTDAADQLYRLTSGFDRVSLVDVMGDLRDSRQAIWSNRSDERSLVNELTAKKNKLKREVDELTAAGRRWSKIALQSSELDLQLKLIAEKIVDLERTSRVVEVSLQIRDRWQSRRLIDEQIVAIGKLPEERDVSIKALEKLNNDIAENRGSIDQCRKQRTEISDQAKSLPINRTLWRQAPRIEALQEHSPWIDSLERQIQGIRSKLTRMKADVGGQIQGLQSHLPSTKDLPKFGPQTVDSLRKIARNLRDAKAELASARGEYESAEGEQERLEEELKTELASRGIDRLTDSLDDNGRLVNRLRRRVQLNEKIDKHELQRKEIEHDIEALIRDQALPVWKMFWLGAIVVTAVVLILLSFFSQEPTLFDGNRPLCLFLGIVFGIMALVLKLYWDQSQQDELDDRRHQLDLIRQQIKRAVDERSDIDEELPSGITHYDTRLGDAETDMLRLQDLVPLEAKVKAARAATEECESEVSECEEALRTSQKRWKSKLRSLGLPENLMPNSVKEIAQRSEKITLNNSKVREQSDELSNRERELMQVTDRIKALFIESGLTPENDDPRAQLKQLSISLLDQRSLIDRRTELANEYRRLRKSENRRQRQLEKLLGAKSRMLGAVGALTEEEYREFAVKHEQVRQLREKRLSLDEQIAAAIGGQLSEDEIAGELDSFGATALEKRWEQVLAEIEDANTERSLLHQQRGEFIQEMKMLAEDRRLDEARLELKMIEKQLDEAIAKWQVTAATCFILERVRESYEAERQPETLKEASEFLTNLTGGKYTRIWTKLTENCLLVDNAEQESLAVEVLSRGTREAVYLALRMALVAAYARRGVRLPMVFDDVLVNFDSTRAKNAAIALRDFARRGYQLLMFTCHDHMRDLFRELDVDARDLPHHSESAEHGARVLPGRIEVQKELPPIVETPVKVEPVVVQPVATAPTKVKVNVTEARPTMYINGSDIDAIKSELEYELSAIRSDNKVTATQEVDPDLMETVSNTPFDTWIDLSDEDAA